MAGPVFPDENARLHMMNGTTLCPHCDTRFKIMEAQLAAHQGMVRCGHCLQAFDARPTFIPDQPDPQLELPILDEPAAEIPTETSPLETLDSRPPKDGEENISAIGTPRTEDVNEPSNHIGEEQHLAVADEHTTSTPAPDIDVVNSDSVTAEEIEQAHEHNESHETLDFSQPHKIFGGSISEPAPVMPARPVATLAEQVRFIEDEQNEQPQQPLKWPWVIASMLCLLLLIGQAAYFFRVDIAARLPILKPALLASCQLLGCAVPLPQESTLMSIESSGLEADPKLENKITLNALLRNRAAFSQAFPYLELTLNDTQDQALARRIFKPADYLPPIESEQFGLLPNHELGIKLHLDVTDLKPTGYRLVLFYPNN